MRVLSLLLAFCVAVIFAKREVFYPTPGYSLKAIQSEEACTLIQEGAGPLHKVTERTGKAVVEFVEAVVVSQHDYFEGDNATKDEIIWTIYGKSKQHVHEEISRICKFRRLIKAPVFDDLKAEPIPFVKSGPSDNRIDFVLMGDGYTANQKDAYIADMDRLFDESYSGELAAFKDYFPLYNLWGVWVPSRQTGVGTGGKPLDTAFGLYRPGTELRAIFTSKAAVAREACKATGPNGCDFPGLIGNSNQYGGLGGEFTIATRALLTGTVVLRHEMGHNMGRVGEEYDGGQVYSGQNFANSLNQVEQKWGKWLSHGARVENSMIRVSEYPWYDMAGGPYVVNFNTEGGYQRWMMVFSTSGTDTPDSLKITLDGQSIPWETIGDLDRYFYTTYRDTPLPAGRHTLTFTATPPAPGGPIRQFCNIVLHEYGGEDTFRWDEDNVSAYKTWRQGGAMVGYRPTNEGCLMRTMLLNKQGPVCQENVWVRFLSVVNLIDNVTVDTAAEQVNVAAGVIPLAQFRPEPVTGEEYELRWERNGTPQPDLDDQYQWSKPKASVTGSWRATLVFKTPQVRRDPDNALTNVRNFSI